MPSPWTVAQNDRAAKQKRILCVYRSGFAARCEAGLSPAVTLLNLIGAVPPVRASALNS